MRKAYSDFTRLDDFGDGNYVESDNSVVTNNLNYDQNVMAGYLAYTINLQKGYSVKAGSRYEYTNIDAYSQTDEGYRNSILWCVCSQCERFEKAD